MTLANQRAPSSPEGCGGVDFGNPLQSYFFLLTPLFFHKISLKPLSHKLFLHFHFFLYPRKLRLYPRKLRLYPRKLRLYPRKSLLFKLQNRRKCPLSQTKTSSVQAIKTDERLLTQTKISAKLSPEQTKISSEMHTETDDERSEQTSAVDQGVIQNF
jgi:hypothetical protein